MNRHGCLSGKKCPKAQSVRYREMPASTDKNTGQMAMYMYNRDMALRNIRVTFSEQKQVV